MRRFSPWVVFSCFGVLLLILGCNKEYTPALNPLEQNTIYLTGNNGSYSQWKIKTLSVGNSTQALLPPSSDYSITYNLNGSFKDSDGMRGSWTMVSKDSITQKITNAASGVYAFQTYRIAEISATSLTLKYTVNAKTVCASYTANR